MTFRRVDFLALGVGWMVLLFAFPAFAGRWGENWGQMVWGSVSAVPTLGWLGGMLLLALLVLTVFWKMKRMSLQAGVTLSLFLLVPVLIAPHITTWNGFTWYTFINGEVADANQVNQNFSVLSEALDVTVPDSFANSGIADANGMNSNFETLRQAVDAFTTNADAAMQATESAFNNGVASVDITTDNAESYASGVASVDITTDNAAVCENAGGTWHVSTSTCAAASGYHCFIAGFCARAAIEFDPANFSYTNLYDGHTQVTEPALGAGCHGNPGAGMWTEGSMMMEDIADRFSAPLEFSAFNLLYSCGH